MKQGILIPRKVPCPISDLGYKIERWGKMIPDRAHAEVALGLADEATKLSQVFNAERIDLNTHIVKLVRYQYDQGWRRGFWIAATFGIGALAGTYGWLFALEWLRGQDWLWTLVETYL